MNARRFFALIFAAIMVVTLLPVHVAHAACSHPSSTGTKVHTSYEQIDGDDDYHLKIDYYVMYCDDCGEVTDMSDERESKQQHSYNKYGKCSVCKYQKDLKCEHDDLNRFQLGYTSYNQISGDETYHEVEKHFKITCDTCGETINHDEVECTKKRHSFDQYGECDDCGYEIEIDCDHEDTSRMQLGNTSYNQIAGNDDKHQVEKHYQITCDDCLEILDYDEEVLTNEDHSLNKYGKCTECGYQVDMQCDHEDTSRRQLGNTSYNQIAGNDDKHQIEKHYQITCDDCLEILDYDEEVLTNEAHIFSSSNTCSRCGYKRACTHAQVEHRYDGTLPIKYTNITETHHGVRNGYRVICNTCGADTGETGYFDAVNYTHDFVNNKCKLCGYQKAACTHTSVKHEYDGTLPIKYTNITETHHGVRNGYRVICNACGADTGETGYFDAVQKTHDFVNNKCKLCGYQKAACTHASYTDTYDSSRSTNYSKITESSHHASYPFNRVCNTCGNVEKIYGDAEQEDHKFDSNNKCKRCGYQKAACTHASYTDTYDSNRPTRYSNISESGHYASYPFKRVCNTCGNVDKIYGNATKESHNFDSNNKCKGCSYQKEACNHDSTNRTQVGETVYNPIDGNDNQHQVEKHYKITCMTCSVTIENDVKDLGIAAHSFNNKGQCTACGYNRACNHASSDRTQIGATKYNQIQGNDNQHQVEKHFKISCITCAVTINSDEMELTTENHDFGSNNTCAQCGYNKAGYYMSVDKGHISGLSAHASGGQGETINVTSNVGWTVTPSDNWIHISNWTGNGNGSFSVSFDSNSGYARQGVITVYGTHGATININVSQAGAIVDPVTCNHVYGYDYADVSDGVWQKVDEHKHKRVTLLYKDVCTLCGDVRYQRRADEGEVVESHTWGATSWSRWLSNEAEHCRKGKKTCTAPGCGLIVDVQEIGEHTLVDGKCVCGFTAGVEYNCQDKGHLDEDGDLVCDMCWDFVPYSSRLEFRLSNEDPQSGMDYMQIMETGLMDSLYIAWYSQYVQGLEAIGNLSVKQWIEANPNLLKFHSINMNEAHANEIVAKLYVDYIYNYAAGDAAEKLTEEECISVLEEISKYFPAVNASLTTISTGENLYELITSLDTATMYDEVVSASLSAGLSVTMEGFERILCMAKAKVVRNRLEHDLGGIEQLPEELQSEMDRILDIWESETASAFELGTTALDSVGSSALQKAMSACPLLAMAHSALSVYTTTTNYDEVGAGLEDIYAIKIMTERAAEAFALAFEEFQKNPTSENYREFVKQKNTYRSYLTVGVATYRDWCIEEAPSEFDADFWNHDKKTQERIDEANRVYEDEMSRIENYFALFD